MFSLNSLTDMDLTISGFLEWLGTWFLIGMAVILVLMLFYGLGWYFFKVWNTKDNESDRSKVNSAARWMVVSWIGLLTLEVIMVILFLSLISR